MGGTPSQEDLLRLEIKLKEADAKDRHDLKDLIQGVILKGDEYKTDQALLQQTTTSMQKKIENIETKIDKGFEKVAKSFEELPTHFATKAEHEANQKSINWIIKVIWTLGTAIIFGGGAFIWGQITSLLEK